MLKTCMAKGNFGSLADEMWFQVSRPLHLQPGIRRFPFHPQAGLP